MKNKYSSSFPMEELIPLLSDLTKKYTSNDSSSITYDKARQLMTSILYSIDQVAIIDTHEQTHLISLKQSAYEAYNLGLSLAKEKIQTANNLFFHISENFNSFKNICYFETVMKGMPGFFIKYDVVYDAQNHILTLDYPLIQPLPGLMGIDLIVVYLQKIHLEQIFLSKFSPEVIISMFSNYHKKHYELIHNVCKFTMRNAIGCILLDRSFYELAIQEDELKHLNSIQRNLTIEELELKLKEVLKVLIKEEYNNNEDLHLYLLGDIKDFAFEFKTGSDKNCLEQIFPTPKKNSNKSKVVFIDGELMDDEKLRNVIEEFRDCQLLSDKLKLLSEHITSLGDLKEILHECFYEDEFTEVFNLLSDIEKAQLFREVRIKKRNSESLYEWEEAIWTYMS